jgi:hypothetical protein
MTSSTNRTCLAISQAGYRLIEGSMPEKIAYRRASDECRMVNETCFAWFNERADQLARSIVDLATELTRSSIMAKVRPPAGKALKGGPPAVIQPVENLEKAEPGPVKNPKFKVSPEFRRTYGMYAISRRMTAKQLLERHFELYQEHHVR